MTPQRIYIDFNAQFGPDLYSLKCRGTIEDLQRLGIQATAGVGLSVYSDDGDEDGRPDNLIAEGIVQNDPQYGLLLYIDPATIRHESDDSTRKA